MLDRMQPPRHPARRPANVSTVEHLERYRPIVDDWPAFSDACQRPLPRVVWANPLRGDIEAIGRRILTRCPDAVPLNWYPGGWRLPPKVKPGNWPEYRMGFVHGQEEAALWPVGVLDPQPGERVLDLCAAPGNKTAQMAIRMQDRGVIVANEKRWDRLASTRHNLERLGVSNTTVVCHDGLHLPDELGPFDRVLADVPCSCEGTGRKPRGQKRGADDKWRWTIVSTQIGLLRRALQLTRPGGIVVYATCTYAPEENERVLDSVWPEFAAIEPITPPAGVTVAPGIPEWDGRVFREDVRHACRFWPHHNNTGGFFVARLRRL